MSQNKTHTQSFCDNFGKCGLIISLLPPKMNCGTRII